MFAFEEDSVAGLAMYGLCQQDTLIIFSLWASISHCHCHSQPPSHCRMSQHPSAALSHLASAPETSQLYHPFCPVSLTLGFPELLGISAWTSDGASGMPVLWCLCILQNSVFIHNLYASLYESVFQTMSGIPWLAIPNTRPTYVSWIYLVSILDHFGSS